MKGQAREVVGVEILQARVQKTEDAMQEQMQTIEQLLEKNMHLLNVLASEKSRADTQDFEFKALQALCSSLKV